MDNNNIIAFSDTFKTYYQNNAFSLFLYKSSRKNSKCELINVNHLINNKEDRKIDDAGIIEQLTGVLETSVYYFKNNNNHIESRICGHVFKQSVYINANGQKYGSVDDVNIDGDRVQFYSIEQYINYLYDKFALLYPYNTISRRELFNNSSVKYFINMYYHG